MKAQTHSAATRKAKNQKLTDGRLAASRHPTTCTPCSPGTNNLSPSLAMGPTRKLEKVRARADSCPSVFQGVNPTCVLGEERGQRNPTLAELRVPHHTAAR